MEEAISNMTAEELLRHPEGKWSIAEILEHLLLTYKGTTKGLERCLQGGKPLASSPTLKQRVSAILVGTLGYFPNGRQAPDRTCPRGMPPQEVIAQIFPQLIAMDDLIAKCETRYGLRTLLLDHPIIGPLTGRQWRGFHGAHGRHHIKQIRQLRKMN
jgi:DinB superfamily